MDTLIGHVPDNWSSVPLGRVCDVQSGPSGATYQTSSDASAPTVRMVTAKAIHDNKINASDLTSVNAAAAAKLRRYQLQAGDLVMVRIGDLRRHAIVEAEHTGWLFGTGCLRLRPHADIAPRYLSYYLNHPGVRAWLAQRANGAAAHTVNTATLTDLPLVFPPRNAQLAVIDVLGALDAKITVHEDIARTTRALRDTLLPKLLDGTFVPTDIQDEGSS
jgi:restriction endonuclease S subunit